MKKQPGTRTGVPIGEQLVAAARAWVAGREIDVDYDDRGIDRGLAANARRIGAIVGDPTLRSFLAPLRAAASLVATAVPGAGGGIRHLLRRDLFLLPVVGPTRDVHALAADATRMRAISEIVRRSPDAPFEDVVLLPVVFGEEALAAPSICGIRSAALLMAACLDAEDLFDELQMAGMTTSVAAHLKGVVPDADRLPPFSDEPSIHAFVGLTSSRFPLVDDIPDFLAFPRSEEAVSGELAEVAGVRLAIGLPGRWPEAATRVALLMAETSLKRLLLREGIPPSTRLTELRYCPSPKGDMLCSGVVDRRAVVGPVSLPVAIASQHVPYMLEGLAKLADASRICTPAELMVSPVRYTNTVPKFDPVGFLRSRRADGASPGKPRVIAFGRAGSAKVPPTDRPAP